MSGLILCFVHNPRTGGASTIQYLREEGHYKAKWRGDSGPRLLDLGSETCGKGEEWKKNFAAGYPQPIVEDYFTAGHFPYGLNDYLKHDNFHYISIIRDPVARVWSRYNTFLNATEYPLHKAWRERYNFDIIRIMQAGEVELCNDQTRLVSGTDSVNIGYGDLAKALFNVEERFSYVTVTERLPEFFLNELHAIIPQVLPGNMRNKYNSIGYGAIGESPSKKIREAILEYNQHDLVLYKTVAKRGKVGIRA